MHRLGIQKQSLIKPYSKIRFSYKSTSPNLNSQPTSTFGNMEAWYSQKLFLQINPLGTNTQASSDSGYQSGIVGLNKVQKWYKFYLRMICIKFTSMQKQLINSICNDIHKMKMQNHKYTASPQIVICGKFMIKPVELFFIWHVDAIHQNFKMQWKERFPKVPISNPWKSWWRYVTTAVEYKYM